MSRACPNFPREYGRTAARCVAKGLDHLKCLLHLAELGFIDRHQRVVEWRIRTARFPVVKSSETFDFPAVPSVEQGLDDATGPL